MFVVTMFLSSDDLNQCKSELQEVAAIVGSNSILFKSLNEAFENAEDFGDGMDEEGN